MGGTTAWAQRDTTRGALDRLEDTLALRVQDAGLDLARLAPLMVVSTAPAFEESRAWYPAAALASLHRAFGSGALRMCEACMAPRTHVAQGRIEQIAGSLSTTEIAMLDETARGNAPPARTAVWIDETPAGISFRAIDLATSQVVLADNFDSQMLESGRTRQNLSLARELDRRARGDSITHAFFDIALYQPRLSLDWVEQWGDRNQHFTGVSFSLFRPVAGLGGAYYRAIPKAWNMMVGAQLLMSVPSGIIRAFGSDARGIDPLLTGAFIARVPFGRSNYGAVAYVSTAGHAGIGISLLNTSVLPFLP
jgi:hypothetical protein